MTVCQHCGACIPDDIPFCDFCGEDLSREPLRQQSSIPHTAEPVSAPRADAERSRTSGRTQTAAQQRGPGAATEKAAAAAAAAYATAKEGKGKTQNKTTRAENRKQTQTSGQTYSERVRAQKMESQPTTQPSGYMKADDVERPPQKTVSRKRTTAGLPWNVLKKRSIPRSRGWLLLYWLIISAFFSWLPVGKYAFDPTYMIVFFILTFPIGLIFLLLWTRKNRQKPGCFVWFLEMLIIGAWLLFICVGKFQSVWSMLSFPAAMIMGGIWYGLQ